MVTIIVYEIALGATLAAAHLNHLGIHTKIVSNEKGEEVKVQVDEINAYKALLELDKWHTKIKEKHKNTFQ
jgi:hypothetical protein